MLRKKLISAIFAIISSSAFCYGWFNLCNWEKFQSQLVPAVAICYVDDQNSSYVFRGNNLDGNKIDSQTAFQIASVSKTLFAWTIIKWAKEHNISIESPIGKIFSGFSTPLLVPFSQLTISQILSHCSGISKVQYRGYRHLKNCPDLYDSLRGGGGHHPPIQLIKTPGESFIYSGAGYTLLEYLVTENGRRSTTSFLEQYFDQKARNFDMPVAPMKPHSIWGSPIDERFFIEKAAAGLWASAATLGAILNKVLSKEESEVLSKMMTVQKGGYGLGLEVEKGNLHHVCFHLGANPGWRSGIFFIPEKNLGLVVLTNSSSGQRIIIDTLIQWLNCNGVPLTDLCRRELLERKIWMFIGWLSFILFFFKILNRSSKNEILIDKKGRKLTPNLLFVGLLLFLSFFYLDSAPPLGWTLASFFSWEFHFFSISLIFLVALNYIDHIKSKKGFFHERR
ncbi:MAG: beta-lactamase family protein [Verrucomicrobia bacterium]|nr:beta-lactamase family protein [Verrucomicrobiota bacterium]